MLQNGIYVKNVLRSDLPKQLIYPKDINSDFPGCVTICEWIDMHPIRRSILDIIFSGLCLDKTHIPLNIRDLQDIRNALIFSHKSLDTQQDIDNLKYLIHFLKHHRKDPTIQVYFYDLIKE